MLDWCFVFTGSLPAKSMCDNRTSIFPTPLFSKHDILTLDVDLMLGLYLWRWPSFNSPTQNTSYIQPILVWWWPTSQTMGQHCTKFCPKFGIALSYKSIPQQTQNICITFVQRRPNVFNAGPTLYKCHTNVLCLMGLLFLLTLRGDLCRISRLNVNKSAMIL